MLLNALQLPDSVICSNKVSKKSIVEQSPNSIYTTKLLQNFVSEIRIVAHLTPDNCNVNSYTDTRYEYLELMVLYCDLKDVETSPANIKALHELFHKLIPYPLIVGIRNNNAEQWSLAEKNINQADIDNEDLVLRNIQQTDWLDRNNKDDLTMGLIKAISFDRQPQSDFLVFYENLQKIFVAYQLSRYLDRNELQDTGNSYTDLATRIESLKAVQQLQEEISALVAKRNKASQFNEKVELNLKIQKLKKQLDKY